MVSNLGLKIFPKQTEDIKKNNDGCVSKFSSDVMIGGAGFLVYIPPPRRHQALVTHMVQCSLKNKWIKHNMNALTFVVNNSTDTKIFKW